MRNAFAQELYHIASKDRDVVLLSGDIGNRLFDPFKNRFSNRFYNCGIAEANMVGVAAGLSLAGLKPVSYTIAPFLTARAYEQIRIDVCYNNLPVLLVGVGSGLSYASLGTTHHGLDDISLMRGLPNMTVVCPGDAVEVRLALRLLLERNKPAYLRIGKKNERLVHEKPPQITIGKASVISSGEEILLISTGNMLPTAMDVMHILAKDNLKPEVVSMHTVKPIDDVYLKAAFCRFSLIVCIEEHWPVGGLSDAISNILLSERTFSCDFLPFTVPDYFINRCASIEDAREKTGLNPESIAKKILKRVK